MISYKINTHKGIGLKVTGTHLIPVIRDGKEILLSANEILENDDLIASPELAETIDKNEYLNLLTEIEKIPYYEKEFVITNIKQLRKWLDYKHNIGCLSKLLESETYRYGTDYIYVGDLYKLRDKYNIPYEILITLEIKATNGKDSLPLMLPITDDLAKFVGYIHSDGSVSINQEKSSYQCAFINFDPKMQEAFKTCFTNTFDTPFQARYTGEEKTGYIFSSKLLCLLLTNDIFGIKKGAANISAPNFVLSNCNDDIKWAYISGLIDGDGCLKDRSNIRYGTVCENLANQLTMLLNQLGVKSGLTKRNSKGTIAKFKSAESIRNYDTYVVNITGYNNINMVCSRLSGVKQKRIEAFYAEKPKKSIQYNPQRIMEKIEISDTDIYVYDIETVEHWFIANDYVVHNCVQHPLDKILKEGFRAGHGSSRPAKRIETAGILGCISMETCQNEMHGGQSIPAFDFYLAPYVRFTYIEEIKLLEQYDDDNYSHLYDIKIDEYEIQSISGIVGDKKIIQHAINRTVERVHQSMEAFIHNMNTIHSRGGNQVVFSSINYGTDTSPEGRCVIRELLKSTYRGVGNNETAIFPIQIWKKKRGVNYLQEDKNYDLFKFACRVSARRFFPNFLNLDATFNQDERWKQDDPTRYKYEVATMGCRTRVYENRFGEKTSIGRGNLSFTTVNIVKIAIECMSIVNKEERVSEFFKKLDNNLEIAAIQLNERFEFQKTAMVKQFPLLMSSLWIGCEDLSNDDTIEKVINHGTLGIGFIGLAECLKALTGYHHGESDEAQQLGLKIVSYIKAKADVFSERYQHNYSVLATPAEGLSGRFVSIDKKQFGTIDGITDKDYYTNSNHIPVYHKCTAEEKARLESPYHDLTRGGHIFYIELDGDATHNIDAVMSVVDLIDQYNIGYGSVNHNRTRCMNCGYEGAEENLQICPKCGSDKIDCLQRITGYLVGTTERWNKAKLAELKDRVQHGL